MIGEFDILDSYSRYEDMNLLKKALTSATNSGEALVPEILEQNMTQTYQRLSPELAIWSDKGAIIKNASKWAKLNRIINMPRGGSSMGESGTTPTTNSAIQRAQEELKIFRRKGAVTDFLRDASIEYADSMRIEMDNQLKVQIWDLITSLYFGNAAANIYDMNGLETVISTNRISEARGGTAITSLKILDDMIDAANRKGGGSHHRVFLTSPEMISALTRYETTVRKNITMTAQWSETNIPGGYRLETYRGVPLVGTTHLSPVEQMSPTVTLASGGGTGGNLSDGTYYIQVAPVTNQGEQLASIEGSVTLSGGTPTQRIKITLSAAHIGAHYYKIYASSTSGAELLVRIYSANYYDGNGSLSITIENGTAGYDFYVNSMTAGSEVPLKMVADVPLVATGGINPEYLILQDLDPIQGLGKIAYANIETGNLFGGLITTEPLAKIDAYRQFLIHSHCTLVPSYEATSFVRRGLRVA